MDADQIVVSALGRPFTLGMLYDARKEQIIPGVSLWDENNLQKMMKKYDQHGSNYQITTSDSLDEKSSLLDINGSVKASFLGGLIEVEGSAKFLNDRKQSFHQSRVTFQYNATTIFKQLMFSAADFKKNQQLSNCVRSSATHVVTGILYGATGFFVFDSETSGASSVQEVEGSMKAMIKKIPSFNVGGNIDIKLNENEKKLSEKMSCKFYGDFLLDSNPATFEEAVKLYTELPKLLKDKEEGGVSQKVWMMPLKSLTSSAAVVMAEISPASVRKVQDALEALHQLKIRCNKCLDVGYHFPSIFDKLNNLEKCCDENKAKLQDILAENLPRIRSGEKTEEELLKFIDDEEKSPFNTEELKWLMKNIEREVTVIRTCEEMMKAAKIIPGAAELDAETLDPEVEEVLCFVFTSLESKAEKAWYFNNELIEKVRNKARILGDVARALKNTSRYRCLVTAINDADHEGATIYHYRNIECLSKDFKKSYVGDVEKITERKNLIWYATELTLDPDTAHPNITLLEEKRATHEEKPKPYPDLPQRFDRAFQVLCREKLNGRHYWEVEFSFFENSDVYCAVGYGSMKRRGDSVEALLGLNKKSWRFEYFREGEAEFRNLHNNVATNIPVPPTGCPRVGIFLDWEKGSLSSYIVTDDQLSHIHTFRTTFSEPVYPAFGVFNKGSFVRLCF